MNSDAERDRPPLAHRVRARLVSFAVLPALLVGCFNDHDVESPADLCDIPAAEDVCEPIVDPGLETGYAYTVELCHFDGRLLLLTMGSRRDGFVADGTVDGVPTYSRRYCSAPERSSASLMLDLGPAPSTEQVRVGSRLTDTPPPGACVYVSTFADTPTDAPVDFVYIPTPDEEACGFAFVQLFAGDRKVGCHSRWDADTQIVEISSTGLEASEDLPVVCHAFIPPTVDTLELRLDGTRYSLSRLRGGCLGDIETCWQLQLGESPPFATD